MKDNNTYCVRYDRGRRSAVFYVFTAREMAEQKHWPIMEEAE